MENVVTYLSRSDAPNHLPCKMVDVCDLSPTRSRQTTLEQLADVENTVVTQVNDRRPRQIRSELEERDYEWQSLDAGDCVVTIIWQE